MNLKKQIRVNFRKVVFERDGNKCVMCGTAAYCYGGGHDLPCYLDVHHICDRSLIPNGGYILENGITLCKGCHWKAEQYHSTGIPYPGYSPQDLFDKIGSSLELALERAKL